MLPERVVMRLAIALQIFMGVNLLQTTGNERGPVSSRVALLLRSAEGKPLFFDFYLHSTQGPELFS